MRQNRVLIVAIEVSDPLYPEVLKIAAHDIEHYDYPIAVYQACSLDVYQHDSGFRRVNLSTRARLWDHYRRQRWCSAHSSQGWAARTVHSDKNT